MEKFPKFNQEEGKKEKEMTEEQIVSLMREKGPKDEEALKALEEWQNKKQAEVSPDVNGSIDYNIALGELLEKAGWIEAAIESYDAAAEIVYQIEENDLLDKMEKKIKSLKEKGK